MNAKKLQRYGLFILLGGLFCAVSLPARVAAQYRGPGTYFIVAKHSGKALDVSQANPSGWSLNGTPIIQFDYRGADHQKFKIAPVYVGSTMPVTIKPISSPKINGEPTKCLDVDYSTQTQVVGLQQWACHGGPNQQFTIENYLEYYKIKAGNRDFYFDIEGWSGENYARLIQYPILSGRTPGDNELFQFIKLN